VAEGAPLLREYTVMSCIKGSNPFVSANQNKATFWVAFLCLSTSLTFNYFHQIMVVLKRGETGCRRLSIRVTAE
jgi:hypothetical protein